MGAAIPSSGAFRGAVRRALRRLVYQAADKGLLSAMATALSALGGRTGLYWRGRILTVACSHADHTDFWRSALQRFPNDAAFLRGGVGAALRSGRITDAEAGVMALLATGRTSVEDCTFVTGLAIAYRRGNDDVAIRHLIRKFLKSLYGRPDYRRAALKLSRLVWASFRRHTVGDLDRERGGNRFQLMRLLARSGVDSSPAAILERVLACEQRLAANSPLFLPDTDISRLQSTAFVRLVQAKLAGEVPFSFVRIGDGEAACLPYEPRLRWLAQGDARERERTWWGRALTVSQRSKMTRLVFNAIWGADCIGIPTAARFLRELRLGENDSLDGNLTGRGLRSILYCVERFASFRGIDVPAPAFTSCHLHQDLARWNLYPELLSGKAEMVLLSCHPGLADFMESQFGAKIAKSLILPPDRVTGPSLIERSADQRLLPEILDDVLSELGDSPQGRLVLVGAGYLGKWLVDVARARGGVALDLGSVFDQWLGLPTRGYLDLHAFARAKNDN